jgi:hypothetical protein
MLPHAANALGNRPNRLGGFALLMVLSALPLYAQKPSPNPPPPLPPPPVFVDSKAPDYGPPPVHTPTFEELQYRKYLESRLKSMVSDADKLLKLAQDLNKEADTPTGSLSREDLRKVAEIEKLAHSVKWKMQLAVNGTQAH